eukprot:Colp12_sorted_trinity150504_noHs@35235
MGENDSWHLDKSSALRFRPPHGDLLLTSFTDSMPMYGWTAEHCVRELWQNFRDGLQVRFGPNIFIREAEPGYYEAVLPVSDKQVTVGLLDARSRNQLLLRQSQCVLTVQHLQMASGKGGTINSIGGHGEGFKVGINILLRRGFAIEYIMPHYKWKFSLQNFYSQDFRNMCVETLHSGDQDHMDIIITGPQAHTLFDQNIDIELTKNIHVVASTEHHGSVLLAAEREKEGLVYCRGLFVASDKEIAELKISVNLDTQIARDRHLIPGNTWPLIKQMLEQFCEMYKARPMDGGPEDTLFRHLITVCRARRSGELQHAMNYIKSPIRRFISLKHQRPMDTVVFLEDAETVQSEARTFLQMIGRVVVSDAGCLSDVINIDRLKNELLSAAPNVQPVSQEETTCYQYLTKYCQAITKTFVSITLRVKRLDALLAKCTPAFVGDRHECAVDITQLTLGSLKRVALNINGLVFRYWQMREGQDKALAQLVEDFITDPASFQPRQYVEEAGVGMGQRGRSHTHNNMDAQLEDYEEVYDGPGKRKRTDDLKGEGPARGPGTRRPLNTSTRPSPLHDRLKPEATKVRVQPCRGVADLNINTFADAQNEKEQMQHLECNYRGMLIPVEMADGKFVYFDEEYRAELEKENPGLLNRISERMEDFDTAIELLRERISRYAKIPMEELTVVKVGVRPFVYGFTSPPDFVIYVNLVPLAMAADYQAIGKSLFMTMLHEIAHRVHLSHHSEFATELASLVFTCYHAMD